MSSSMLHGDEELTSPLRKRLLLDSICSATSITDEKENHDTVEVNLESVGYWILNVLNKQFEV
jgi:hypothetical protein